MTSWAIVLAVLLQMLGPILKDWLESLLRRAIRRLSEKGITTDASPRAILERLFAEARSEYRWWWPPHWAYRAAVNSVEDALMPEAHAIIEAALGRRPIPELPREVSLFLETTVGELP